MRQECKVGTSYMQVQILDGPSKARVDQSEPVFCKKKKTFRTCGGAIQKLGQFQTIFSPKTGVFFLEFSNIAKKCQNLKNCQQFLRFLKVCILQLCAVVISQLASVFVVSWLEKNCLFTFPNGLISLGWLFCFFSTQAAVFQQFFNLLDSSFNVFHLITIFPFSTLLWGFWHPINFPPPPKEKINIQSVFFTGPPLEFSQSKIMLKCWSSSKSLSTWTGPPLKSKNSLCAGLALPLISLCIRRSDIRGGGQSTTQIIL